MEHSTRSEKGYSLVELMVALLVIAVSVVALYQMLIAGRVMINEENHRRLGLEKAQFYMEKCQFAKSDVGYVPRRYAGTFVEELIPPSFDERDGIDCETVVTIEYSRQVDQNGIPAYSNVKVECTWNELSGRQQIIFLEANL